LSWQTDGDDLKKDKVKGDGPKTWIKREKINKEHLCKARELVKLELKFPQGKDPLGLEAFTSICICYSNESMP